MGASGGPSIVHDGLVFGVDAADKVSFSSGSTTWYDLSTNGNNGILSGSGGTVGTIGTVSSSFKAMAFNGSSDYIEFGDTDDLDIRTSTATVEAWFQVDPTVTDSRKIFTKYLHNSGNEEGWYMDFDHDGTPRIFFDWGAGSSRYAFAQQTSTNGGPNVTGSSAVWHHLVGTTGDGNFTKIYLDGNFVTSSIVNQPSGDNNSDARAMIGAQLNYGTGEIWGHLKGLVGAVRLYNKALSAKEISQNFNAKRSRFGV